MNKQTDNLPDWDRQSKWQKSVVPGPIKAIRNFCIECMGGKPSEIQRCPDSRCPLWAYRFGRRPSKNTRKAWVGQNELAILLSQQETSENPEEKDPAKVAQGKRLAQHRRKRK